MENTDNKRTIAADGSGALEQPIYEADTRGPIGTGDPFVDDPLASYLQG